MVSIDSDYRSCGGDNCGKWLCSLIAAVVTRVNGDDGGDDGDSGILP